MRRENWYKFHQNQILTLLQTDFENGLDMAEAKKRLKKYRSNELFPRESLRSKNRRKNNIGTATVLLILVSLVYYFITHDKSAFFICCVAAVNYLCVSLAYRKSRKIIIDSEKYSPIENRVIRNGKIFRVDQKAIVPGDVVLLREGDIVPCDGRIISLTDFKVLEMNISGGNGEKDADFISYDPSLPVKEQKNMVFAASVVFKGEAKIVACTTGADTVARRRNLTNRPASADDLELLQKASKLSDKTVLFMLILVFVLTLIGIISFGVGERMSHTFFLALSYMASAMCEFFAIFAYIAVASGIFFSYSKNDAFNDVIIKNVSSVEKMNRITCLAIPKNSGICEEEMQIEFLLVNGREYKAAVPTEKTDRFLKISRMTVLSETPNLSVEEKAILKATPNINADYKILEFVPIGPTSLFDTALVFENGDMNIFLRGGVAEILNRCVKRRCGEKTAILESEIINDYITKAEHYQKNGYKVVAFASKKTSYANLQKIVYAQTELCFEGLLIMREYVVSDCEKTIKNLSEAGIKVLLFCDDISKRNEYLARSLGIIKDSSQVITSYEFLNSNLNLQNIKLKNYTLFQGFDGKQKKYVLDRLRKSGEYIGILGSTITDVSLTAGQSVVSFSTGLSAYDDKNVSNVQPSHKTGNEVLKLKADAVIRSACKMPKSGINAVYQALRISARIYDTAMRVLAYLFTSSLLRLILVVLSSITSLVDLTPSQVIFSGLAIDLCGVFAICSGKDKSEKIKSRKAVFSKENLLHSLISHTIMACFACLLLIVIRCIVALNGASASVCNGCFSFSWMMCQIALILVVYGKDKERAISGISPIIWIFTLLITELFFVSELFPSFTAFTAFGTSYTKYLPIIIIPSVVIIAWYFAPVIKKYFTAFFKQFIAQKAGHNN